VFSENDITGRVDPTTGSPTVFRLARGLEVNLQSAPPDIANGRLILSSEQSYGERDLVALGTRDTFTFEQGEDVPGPLDLAVFANHRETDARIVLVGDSDFVTNGQVNNGGNAVFFTDAMAWLTRLNEELEYAPQAYTAGLPLLYLDPAAFSLIAVGVGLVLPGTIALLGIAVAQRRVRRGRAAARDAASRP
jgi:hypothetical protein